MKCDLLEGSTYLIPGFEHQLRLELVEQLELELPCLVVSIIESPLNRKLCLLGIGRGNLELKCSDMSTTLICFGL